jgi:hypothetical protein
MMMYNKFYGGDINGNVANVNVEDAYDDPEITRLDRYRHTATQETPNIEIDPNLSHRQELEQLVYSDKIKNSLYGGYGTPIVSANKLEANGLPFVLGQHPNKYSANPNQVLLYKNITKFTDSPFYTKYKPDLVQVKAKTDWNGHDIDFIIPGKTYRIVFGSMSKDDKTKYYIDNKIPNDYLQVLIDAKNSQVLVPVEFMAMAFLKNNAEKIKQAIENSKYVWSEGYDYQTRKYKNAIAEQQAHQREIEQQEEADREQAKEDTERRIDRVHGELQNEQSEVQNEQAETLAAENSEGSDPLAVLGDVF